MSSPLPTRTEANCECGLELRADDYEALVATAVEHFAQAHAEWQVGEQAVRNYLEALDRLTGPTERLDIIGPVEVHAVDNGNITDVLRFFDHDVFADNPGWASCYCMFHHVDHAGWADRSARQNRADLDDSLQSGRTTAVVAGVGGKLAGWCNASFRRAYPAHRDGSPDDDRVAAIVCFAVAPPYRGHGIARRLVDAAVERVGALGAIAVEAYPVRDPSGAPAAYHGTVDMFSTAGFEIVSEDEHGIVMRKVLGVSPVTIPTYRYTSAAFAQAEMDRLWPRVWQFACTLDQVARPGDWYEHRVGHYSVVIVRGDDGELRAFQNACRHRGSALCQGSGEGLTEIRCPFHRWTWDLRGQLREVPSRREFGVVNDDLPLIRAEVDTWGPLVFVNLDPRAEPLAEFLDPVPADSAWADLDAFHCTAAVSIPARCNWKTLIDGFSETYHVQGIHREMLPMCDDVNGPQQVWRRHGKLEQPYGLGSPRLRDRPDDQQVWDAFVQIMGNRVGRDLEGDAGPAPSVPAGSTLRDEIAAIIRARAEAQGLDYSDFTLDQTLNMSQYNLFPNITVLVFSDMLNVVRSRPAATHLDAYMDIFTFERRPAASQRSRPFEMELDPAGDLPLGIVLNQDLANFEGSQRGMHQPGLTHLSVSATEECRIVNLHVNLEEFLDISPSELTGVTR